MFGGPIDLTPFGALVKGAGIIYWLLAAAGLWWALRGERPWQHKVLRALPVVLVFGFWPVRLLWAGIAADQRLIAAKAHFEMRCKSAGEKILRTVDNVDGIVLLKLRPQKTDHADQFLLDDPYGRDCSGESCISTYLIDYRMVPTNTGGVAPSNKALYRYVEMIDPSDGRTYRYEQPSARAPVSKTVTVPSARYGVLWDDISTKEDRTHWVAGGSLKVVDMQTQQVIAERTGYLMDRGQGSTAGGRSPWSWARAYGPVCPPVAEHNLAFITKVVQPKNKN